MRKCLSCGAKVSGHFNRKRCRACVAELRRRPQSSLTQAQIAQAKTMIGKMPREEIARRLGVSLPSLKRAFRGVRLAFHNYCQANPSLVRQVNAFYEENGNKRTAEHFGISRKQVEHIVYRYRFSKPRQIRWSDPQIAEAAKMSGLISHTAQAKYFNRPNAFNGSIKALWTKRFGFMGTVNGMAHWYARELVDCSAQYLKPKGNDRRGDPTLFRWIILWVDMEKCLRPDVPEFIQDAIKTMADFQRWIWKSKNPKPLILKMIQQREL